MEGLKILVIGGTGPTGPHVVNGLIRRGHKVEVLHRGVHEEEFIEPVEHLHGDPHFKETLSETLGNRSYDLVIAMYGRIRYIAEVMKGRTARFIATGGSVYNRGLLQFPIPESAPLRKEPKLFYQIWLTEQEVMEAHQQKAFSATYLRYPSVYGPRQTVPQDWCIVRRILDGRNHFILPDGGLGMQSMGYAENAAHALLLVADNPEKTAGKIYNVRDEAALTFRQRVEIISKTMGYDWELVDIPFELALASWPSAARWHPGGPWEHGLTDISKIKFELGYKDIIAVEQGIVKTVKWLLENRPVPGGTEEIALGDRFGYDLEDKLIEYFKDFQQKARALPFKVEFRHSYDHPKKPGEVQTLMRKGYGQNNA